ncbi:MAG TPA: hypothetical protein VGR37_22860, partial [Longimicrobiaceae bacterium]|nr:hypothetical protein [Longimicrobiaceae bacterium]
MPSPNPLWLQRLPAEVRRRLELAEARAREAVAEAHAAQALELVAILAPRMPFDEAIDRYVEIMELSGDEEEIVRTRALSDLSDPHTGSELARERPRGWGFDWRYATPVGALRFIRRQIRRSAEEDLWMELFAARTWEALIRTHFKHALHFVDVLEEHAPPTQAVSLYIAQLEVPAGRAASVYQRVLARLAEQFLPRLD